MRRSHRESRLRLGNHAEIRYDTVSVQAPANWARSRACFGILPRAPESIPWLGCHGRWGETEKVKGAVKFKKRNKVSNVEMGRTHRTSLFGL